MSTNCGIAVKVYEGYKTIYCHWGGYPGYMYPLLRDWYGTKERAEALVSFGDASYITKRLVPSLDSDHSFNNPEKGVCVFYHRDRQEPWTAVAPKMCTLARVLKDYEYVYIFENDSWSCYEEGERLDYCY
jgi:hypothetical protein